MKFDWYRLFHPSFWDQNHPTSWEWDAKLNKMMDDNLPVRKGYLTYYIDGIEVWASNYPYSYALPYEPRINVLPSALTRLRFKKYVISKARSR